MPNDKLGLPPPLTGTDCDLTDFQYMELDVRSLRDSKFAATVEAEAFRAGVLLWCASWHQIPAGSLPDDDVELANLAGYGRVVKEWRKVRAEALYGFIKCTDGRLYHDVIARKAASAFEAKRRYAYDKFRDRIRKENKARAEAGHPPLETPTYERWKSGEVVDGIPAESTNNSGGIPAEKPLKGNRTEQNRDIKPSVPNGTGAFAPPAGIGPADAIFQIAVPWLVEHGMKESNARSLLGGARKQLGDDGAWELAQQCMREKPLQPAAWLAAALNARIGTRNSHRGKPTVYDQTMAAAARAKEKIFGAAPNGEVIDEAE